MRSTINPNLEISTLAQNCIDDVPYIYENEANNFYTSTPRNKDTLSDAAAEEDCLLEINDVELAGQEYAVIEVLRARVSNLNINTMKTPTHFNLSLIFYSMMHPLMTRMHNTIPKLLRTENYYNV